MKLIKTQYCPYCEKPISEETVIQQPHKLFSKKSPTFCPHCHNQVQKKILNKISILGLAIFILARILQEYSHSSDLHILSDFWLKYIDIFAFLLASAIIYIGRVNSPFIRSKSSIKT